MTERYQKKELVVNWHITEACNYSCSFCFAKWDKFGRELMLNKEAVNSLLAGVAQLPSLINNQYGTNFELIRLNLVGGETFLNFRKVRNIVLTAKGLGMSVSAITNGSRLNAEWLSLITDNFQSIGFSVDSVNDSTNLKIGRSEKGKSMDVNLLKDHIAYIRSVRPDIEIKINTVVNNENKREDLTGFIKDISPDKWKIFKVLPSISSSATISQKNYLDFVDRHSEFAEIMFPEDNSEMTNSYIMIDPLGRFFQNSNSFDGYTYSRVITSENVVAAFSDITFDIDKFSFRYKHNRIAVTQV